MKSSPWLFVPGLVTLLSLGAPPAAAQPGQPPSPQKVRLVGPNALERGTRNLVYAEGLFDGKEWKRLPPDQISVQVSGAGRLADNPAGRPTNPLEVRCDDVARGQLTVELRAAGQQATKTFAVEAVKPAGLFEATVGRAAAHHFAGLGAGVLFYDNQFDITTGDNLYDWCFKDVRATFLHVLIRPDYEKENDNDDWRSLDLSKFDFASLERPFRIIKKALQRNPKLKIYASLYSPPAWMKGNNSTAGGGSLKAGLRYRQELAEYVFAYLKHARRNGITVHYLSFFNEPDFQHTQDGTYFADLGDLATTFAECAEALDSLIAADKELKERPVYVFPDTLGPGSITRAGKNSQRLRERARLLDRVGVWGVHDYWSQAGTYWNDRYRELRAFPGVGKKPVWMTEWAQRERHGDLASGVEYGTQMLNALRSGAEAWMAFEWCHPSGNQAGLISTDWGAKPPRQRYWRSKAYHVFRQVANTTPPGSQVLAMSGRWKGTSQAGGKGVEYLALRDGEDVIVHLMNSEPAPVSCRVSIPGTADKAEGWLTTPLADVAEIGAKELTVGRQGEASTVSGTIPGHSLLSFVLRGRPAKKNE